MSLNSLASSRVAGELARVPQPAEPAGRGVRAEGAAITEDRVGPGEEDVQNSLSQLIEYVPAETISLYLASVAALPVLVESVPWITAVRVYWVYALLTPLLYVLMYAGKRNAAGEARWPSFSKWKTWPIWPMVAATVAFLVWALTVPSGPYLTDDGGRVLSGLLAIIVSTLLGVAGRFFAPKPS